jgi:hypothetical protein
MIGSMIGIKLFRLKSAHPRVAQALTESAALDRSSGKSEPARCNPASPDLVAGCNRCE